MHEVPPLQKAKSEVIVLAIQLFWGVYFNIEYFALNLVRIFIYVALLRGQRVTDQINAQDSVGVRTKNVQLAKGQCIITEKQSNQMNG